jgi:hypothetical protein
MQLQTTKHGLKICKERRQLNGTTMVSTGTLSYSDAYKEVLAEVKKAKRISIGL